MSLLNILYGIPFANGVTFVFSPMSAIEIFLNVDVYCVPCVGKGNLGEIQKLPIGYGYGVFAYFLTFTSNVGHQLTHSKKTRRYIFKIYFPPAAVLFQI